MSGKESAPDQEVKGRPEEEEEETEENELNSSKTDDSGIEPEGESEDKVTTTRILVRFVDCSQPGDKKNDGDADDDSQEIDDAVIEIVDVEKGLGEKATSKSSEDESEGRMSGRRGSKNAAHESDPVADGVAKKSRVELATAYPEEYKKKAEGYCNAGLSHVIDHVCELSADFLEERKQHWLECLLKPWIDDLPSDEVPGVFEPATEEHLADCAKLMAEAEKEDLLSGVSLSYCARSYGTSLTRARARYLEAKQDLKYHKMMDPANEHRWETEYLEALFDEACSLQVFKISPNHPLKEGFEMLYAFPAYVEEARRRFLATHHVWTVGNFNHLDLTKNLYFGLAKHALQDKQKDPRGRMLVDKVAAFHTFMKTDLLNLFLCPLV